MPCGKTAGNSGNDDAGERMERKIEEYCCPLNMKSQFEAIVVQ